jgi:hypothetical protein
MVDHVERPSDNEVEMACVLRVGGNELDIDILLAMACWRVCRLSPVPYLEKVNHAPETIHTVV